MDINQIKELIRAVEESGIGEVTVEEAGTKITVRAPGQFAAGQPGQPGQGAASAEGTEPIAVAQSVPVAQKPSILPPDGHDRPGSWLPVVSPMVGTFYAAPAPDAPPFVQVGDDVVAGQALCIVEAMKLMNEVPAEQMGTIREVCIENAMPVEFGTVLFYIEPTLN